MKLIICSLLLLSIVGCSTLRDKVSEKDLDSQKVQNSQRSIDESEASQIAEDFIAQNGYTDLQPTDKSKLSYESMEGETSADEVLKFRHNTLERKAYGVIKNGINGWTVVFRYKKDNLELQHRVPDYEDFITKYGRAVTMNSKGDDIRVEHQDILLESVKKLL